MADHIYDLIIIGAGPAGYTAALRAAAMGMDAVLIEKKALGGHASIPAVFLPRRFCRRRQSTGIC